ncbi:MAG: DUF3046 domain-containing protein [Actinomycetales bacterium]
MRLTDFWERMDAALGPGYSRSWAADVVLPALGCTVDQALQAGCDTREVWRAVCEVAAVPNDLRA